MPTVYHSGPNNSTFFTTCCQTAILDEQRCCPRCGEEVTPHSRSARWEVAFGPERQRIRARQIARGQSGTGASYAASQDQNAVARGNTS